MILKDKSERQQLKFNTIIDRSKENYAPLFDPKFEHNFKSTMFRFLHCHNDSVIRTESLLQRTKALGMKPLFE